ncbi:D-serine deaminase, pyridoxal phosphate-dependent [Reichenbachiella faecimaris]|uniref:D-serine deaminase, pyridoxal phosphate-dependent n=1 Tax=Reichenbachiella faecimaris TaxID=692418 RepID=A0A1W2GF43_REIFA|nr:alanine racemase [Reichenbachiella faecimaris]SMD34968.1 D-serine deaminase, pyridoxal phosphate-dependent [Reichenbachiella faecimaris]
MYRITKPTLLLDKKKAIQNIKRMAEKAKSSGVTYRPHFKTHFSQEVGEWYREQGVTSITVSSIDMAVFFAGHGWDDIIIAFPVNVLQLDVLKLLAKQVKLGLVVESQQVIESINSEIEESVDIYIKIDTGYHRVGIWHEEVNDVKGLGESVAKPHVFKGLLAHFGHTYSEIKKEEIKSIYQYGVGALNKLRDAIDKNLKISIGDTPSCSVMDSFENVDEIRPGNLVFYDIMQVYIGSCQYSDIAVCLAVPVVAVYPERAEIVVHGGAVHLSKERLEDAEGSYFGKVVALEEKGWSAPLDNYRVKGLSQEHGKISVPQNQIEKIKVGDVLGILPIHSCLTVNLMKEYMTLRGEKIGTMHL